MWHRSELIKQNSNEFLMSLNIKSFLKTYQERTCLCHFVTFWSFWHVTMTARMVSTFLRPVKYIRSNRFSKIFSLWKLYGMISRYVISIGQSEDKNREKHVAKPQRALTAPNRTADEG